MHRRIPIDMFFTKWKWTYLYWILDIQVEVHIWVLWTMCITTLLSIQFSSRGPLYYNNEMFEKLHCENDNQNYILNSQHLSVILWRHSCCWTLLLCDDLQESKQGQLSCCSQTWHANILWANSHYNIVSRAAWGLCCRPRAPSLRPPPPKSSIRML